MKYTEETLDAILHLQLRVAWAGEALCDPPRLGWWRTDLLDPMSGGDFIERLARRTHAWAGLQAVREAARLVDQASRRRMADPDGVRTIYFWGFDLDEQLSERLREQKMSLQPAPDQGVFDRQALASEFAGLADANATVQSSGRLLPGPMPDLTLAAQALVAALVPFAGDYPVPFYQVNQEGK